MATVTQRITTAKGGLYLNSISDDVCAQEAELIQLPERPAYAVTDMNESTMDTSFKAIMSATKGAAANAKLLTEQGDFRVLFFPVVVTSGRLFEVYLNPAGKPEACELPYASMVWRRPTMEKLFSNVFHIFTANHIEHLVQMAKSTTESLGAEIVGKD